MSIFRTCFSLFFILILYLPLHAQTRIKLATTTSTYDSGLLDVLLPPFEKEKNVRVEVIAVGTGKALKLAENGDVDVVMVHARKLEDAFVTNGFGVNRRDVMYNDFVIVGPVSDPAGISGMNDAASAVGKIAKQRAVFVSRGDESGTHQKEKELWTAAELTPAGTCYLAVGQGMAATLRMADEKSAYCLVDRGTYLALKEKVDLAILTEGDLILFNPYGIIAVNPDRWPHVRYDLAVALIKWMMSEKGQQVIGEYKRNGETLFTPSAQ